MERSLGGPRSLGPAGGADARVMTLAENAVLAGHFACLGTLVLYGVHRLHLLRLRRRHGPPPPLPRAGGEAPHVTVQLPLYNERRVAGRLLRAVGRLDYPRDRLEVQVLDDSDDGTVRLAAAGVRWLRRRGIDAHHIRRPVRDGYKAGALEEGRRRARGELIAVLDADFIPPPGFLRRLSPAFRDPRVGMVQARWGHLNRDENLLTRVQAVMLDGHFAVEHEARACSGRFFNFNGTAGIWRGRCLEEAGGWSAVTLTEDLDVSYRAQMRGWEFRYAPGTTVPAELPASREDFRGQQTRWARGSIQTCRRLLPAVLASRQPWRVKAEAAVHLTANLCYPLMLGVALTLFPAQEIRVRHGLGALGWLDAALLLAGTLSLAAFYAAAAGRRGLRALAPLMAVGAGLSLSNTVAAVEGLCLDGGTFRRTPKRGARRRPAYIHPPSPLALGELVLGGYLSAAAGVAAVTGAWAGVPFLALFAAGYLHAAFAAAGRITRRAAGAGGRGSRGPLPSRDPWASPARPGGAPTAGR